MSIRPHTHSIIAHYHVKRIPKTIWSKPHANIHVLRQSKRTRTEVRSNASRPRSSSSRQSGFTGILQYPRGSTCRLKDCLSSLIRQQLNYYCCWLFLFFCVWCWFAWVCVNRQRGRLVCRNAWLETHMYVGRRRERTEFGLSLRNDNLSQTRIGIVVGAECFAMITFIIK